MDKQIRDKWVRALRSGRYKQTQEYLYDGRGYCCLGVLARVQGAKPSEIKQEGLLTGDLKKYSAGIRRLSQCVLSEKNDGVGLERSHTFKEIADYIEKRY